MTLCIIIVLQQMKHYLTGLILLVVFGLGFLYIANNQPQKPNVASQTPQGYEYFWGDGCPHCANVSDFLSNWSGLDKISLTKLEVWKNRDNAETLQKRASSCGIADDKVGVPFLYTPDGKCIVGDQPIISYFQNLNPQ